MKRGDFLPAMTLTGAFEQFLEGSPFARRTRESYTEDLAPLNSSWRNGLFGGCR